MSTEPTFQTEPTAPVVQPFFRGRPAPADGGTVGQPSVRTRQGSESLPDHRGYEQSEADKREWERGRELEERKARTADQLAKRIEKPELTAEYFKEETANVLAERISQEAPDEAINSAEPVISGEKADRSSKWIT
jgi:hypothetical protein